MSFEDSVERRIQKHADRERADSITAQRESYEKQMREQRDYAIARELGKKAANLLLSRNVPTVPWCVEEVTGTYKMSDSSKSGSIFVTKKRYEHRRDGDGWYLYYLQSEFDQMEGSIAYALRTDGAIGRFQRIVTQDNKDTFAPNLPDDVYGMLKTQLLSAADARAFAESDKLEDGVASVLRTGKPYSATGWIDYL